MLFIVCTPIGNLDDLSLRQAKTLVNSDIILAEDTRSAQTLLNACQSRFKFHPDQIGTNFKFAKLVSYYKEKEFEKLPEIIEYLKQNKKVSLISESGMPLISEPGYLLVKTVIKEKIPLTVIPGPSAVTAALAYSGFNPVSKNGGFMFRGFLPKKPSAVLQLFNQLKQVKRFFPEMIFVFFESPQRINNTLRLFVTSEWDPDIVICREITKKFEEIIRGKAKDLIKRSYKGEITVLVS